MSLAPGAPAAARGQHVGLPTDLSWVEPAVRIRRGGILTLVCSNNTPTHATVGLVVDGPLLEVVAERTEVQLPAGEVCEVVVAVSPTRRPWFHPVQTAVRAHQVDGPDPSPAGASPGGQPDIARVVVVPRFGPVVRGMYGVVAAVLLLAGVSQLSLPAWALSLADRGQASAVADEPSAAGVIGEPHVPPPVLDPVVPPRTGVGSASVDFALAQLGTPYSQCLDGWPRCGPGGRFGHPSGFGGHYDCSGLVHRAWAEAGVDLGSINTTWQMMRAARSGGPLSHLVVAHGYDPAAMAPGDVLVWNRNGAGHSGIYLGDGRVVHASSSRGVVVDPLTSWWTGQVQRVLRPGPLRDGGQ